MRAGTWEIPAQITRLDPSTKVTEKLHNEKVCSDEINVLEMDHMSAFIDEEVFALEGEEHASSISELIPIHVESEEICEPDVAETSQIVIFLDECSSPEAGKPQTILAISSKIGPEIGPLELEKIIGELFDAENVSRRGKGESIPPRDYELPAPISKTGAIDEVIKQLMESMRSNKYEVLCYMIVGRNYLKREREISAIQCFKRGLHIRNLTEDDKIAFYFELGQTYQSINDPREAVYYYKKVGRHNPQYRDVARRLELLLGRL